jgi:cellulose synthase/poly-beta-1,6-N-acetylglucosamine synthase-like glycosyltransferase
MTTQTKQIKKVKSVPRPATVTLCMIVKNESHIIKECLESMLPYIDRYDITDTGSTDGTPELIKEFFDEYGIEGEVYLSDWKGFGDGPNSMGSRTESFNNAEGKAEYAWVIDADYFITGEFEYPTVFALVEKILFGGEIKSSVLMLTGIMLECCMNTLPAKNKMQQQVELNQSIEFPRGLWVQEMLAFL